MTVLIILYMSNFHHKSTPDEVTPKNTHRLVFNLQSWNPTWQWRSLQREYEVWDILPWYFCCWFRLWQLTLPNGTWRQMHFNTFIHTLVCWIMRSTTTILPLEVNLHQGSPIVDGKSFVPKIGNHFSIQEFHHCAYVFVYGICIYIYMWMYMYTNQINLFNQLVFPVFTINKYHPHSKHTMPRFHKKPHRDSAEVIAVAGHKGRCHGREPFHGGFTQPTSSARHEVYVFRTHSVRMLQFNPLSSLRWHWKIHHFQ